MARLKVTQFEASKVTDSGVTSSEHRAPETDVELNSLYRSLCKSAIISTAFAFFSSLILLMIILVPELGVLAAAFAFFGVIFGIIAMHKIKQYPEELTGKVAAKFGLIGSLAVIAIGMGFYSYIYVTEVPDGCERINFTMLKPDVRKDETYAERMEKYDGKRVFLKGFVRPSDRKLGLEKFILVGDFGSCCFGGNPKLTDMVAIELKNGLKANYSFRLRRIAGTFRIHKSGKAVDEDGVPNVIYSIDANYIK